MKFQSPIQLLVGPLDGVVTRLHDFFIRAGFIRAEMMSTENFGKIRAGEYSNLLRYKG